MLNINKRLLTTVVSIGLASSILFGCNSKKIKEKMEEGINNLNNGKYEEAEGDFNNVLELNKENKEAESLVNIIENYFAAKKSFENNDINSAKTFIEKIPSNYTDYKIKDDIDKLKSEIKIKLDNIKRIDNDLNKLNTLIAEGKADEARNRIVNVNMKDATKEQKEKAEKIVEKLNKDLEEKRKQEEKQKEEQRKKEELKKIEAQKREREEQIKEEKSKKERESQRQVNKINNNKGKLSQGIHYENKQLGLQMELPASWKGNYDVCGGPDYILFKFAPHGKTYSQPLYCIEKRMKNNTLDSIRYKTINGVDYALGYAPVMFIDYADKNYNLYEKLSNDAHSILDTVRALN
ncbi:outer membrane protein assembly factor BamD [Clostridium baratii]|uniref:hypothetical protein n=1 Tax=Clostridium baratii TaxID=1561 RepID=UPI0029420BBD|nr:hypothetical protein [Clostridium baratii]